MNEIKNSKNPGRPAASPPPCPTAPSPTATEGLEAGEGEILVTEMGSVIED